MSVLIIRTAVVLGCATALTVLPALTATTGSSLFDGIGHAYAKGGGGGNGGGNGGNGNGGGNAGGNGAGASAGKGADHGSRGHGNVAATGSHSGNSKGGGRGAGKGVTGFLGGIFSGGGKSKTEAGRSGRGATAKTADLGRGKGKNSLAKQQEAALKGKAVPVPGFKDQKQEKNLPAKLGRLHSLNRNYHAYLNAKDPKFAAIQAYVMAAANVEITAAALEAAATTLGEAEEAFAAVVSAIEAHNDFSYADALSATALESRLSELEAIDPTSLGDEAAAAALATEIDALSAALQSPEVASLENATAAIADLEASLAEQQAAVTEQSLQEALQAAANPNQQVDEQMVGWAKDVLGVDEAYGKIDQVREALEAASKTDSDPSEEETAGLGEATDLAESTE